MSPGAGDASHTTLLPSEDAHDSLGLGDGVRTTRRRFRAVRRGGDIPGGGPAPNAFPHIKQVRVPASFTVSQLPSGHHMRIRPYIIHPRTRTYASNAHHDRAPTYTSHCTHLGHTTPSSSSSSMAALGHQGSCAMLRSVLPRVPQCWCMLRYHDLCHCFMT